MAWWHKTSKPEDEIIVYEKPGQIAPCDDPQKVIIIPKDPEPDLSTKPKDVVGYCFGFVCPKKHVFGTFETISIDGFKERRVCQTCGGIGKPATVKRTSESQWGSFERYEPFAGLVNKGKWGWFNAHWKGMGKLYSAWAGDKDIYWTKHEFVHYLESPKRRKK